MKLSLIISSLSLMLMSCSPGDYTPKNGDIIFHTSKSNQSQMISDVTKSKLTHVGMIFINDGEAYVYEAVQPVKLTPITEWIKRGVDSKYTVLRSKKDISSEDLVTMKNYGLAQLGKGYDIKFQWSDNKMYCSELVYKVYEQIGVNLSEKHTFEDYTLNSKAVKDAIKKRYGKSFNINEVIVTPVDLHNSNKLSVVFNNY